MSEKEVMSIFESHNEGQRQHPYSCPIRQILLSFYVYVGRKGQVLNISIVTNVITFFYSIGYEFSLTFAATTHIEHTEAILLRHKLQDIQRL